MIKILLSQFRILFAQFRLAQIRIVSITCFFIIGISSGVSAANFDDALEEGGILSPGVELEETERQLRELLLEKLFNDGARRAEHENGEITYDTYTMRFSKDAIGERPENGYPLYIALHGGGQTSTQVNNSQWEHMKIYYKSSVEAGIYVAPRGITDTWNLHFIDESYSLYDLMVENMVAYEDVDPNRVYIMGFSAGGDGVYQITPKLADRWAAANMSAGHRNWVSLENTRNTPMLLQMGEYDSAFSRNVDSVNSFELLNGYENSYGGYIHDLFMHLGGSHNSWRDNDNARNEYSIISDPISWRDTNNRTSISRNTNAIDWLNQHQRNPYPTKIVWDATTFAHLRKTYSRNLLENVSNQQQLSDSKDLFYWLDISKSTLRGRVVASYDTAQQTISIEELDENINALTVLIHKSMFDFNLPVNVWVQGVNVGSRALSYQLKTMARTLLERADHNYMFHDEITLTKSEDGSWTMSL